MLYYSEHAAIVETLIQIERETDWATTWRIRDIEDFGALILTMTSETFTSID